MRWCVLTCFLVLSSGCTTVRPTVITPTPPQRQPPAECLVDADKPVERRKLPPETEQACPALDLTQHIACLVEKARKVIDLKEQDLGGEQVERTRRKACVDFIRAELRP
jgi:hypothetical protein